VREGGREEGREKGEELGDGVRWLCGHAGERTASQHHSITASQHHSITASQLSSAVRLWEEVATVARGCIGYIHRTRRGSGSVICIYCAPTCT
jgi:hypothetical protein